MDYQPTNTSEISDHNKQASGWEKAVLEKLLLAAVTEQRRARRWGVFFKLLMFAYLIAAGAIAFYPGFEQNIAGDGEHTAVVDVIGVIAESEATSAEIIVKGLRAAFKNKKTKGVILNINSPGGSPVQAAYVFTEISKLRKQYPNIPIHAVISDIGTSGSYYIAAAADNIYVNHSSIIGSIGVIMNGFGFVDAMKKLGIDRRLITAGEHKAILDPFSPTKRQETDYMQALVDEVHQQFIAAVRQGRGDRLSTTEDLFSGLIWTGTQSVKLGLADGFGSVDSVATEVIGAKNTLNFTPKEQLLDRIASKLGTSFGYALGSVLNGLAIR